MGGIRRQMAETIGLQVIAADGTSGGHFLLRLQLTVPTAAGRQHSPQVNDERRIAAAATVASGFRPQQQHQTLQSGDDIFCR